VTGKGNICSQTVALAQLEMDGMHTRLDKAVYDINHLGDDCKLKPSLYILVNQTRGEAVGLSDYIAIDHFKADEFERNIDRNLK
jgi:hypothetical protein